MIRLPTTLIQALSGATGFQPEAFYEAHLQPPPISVRLNPVKLTIPKGQQADPHTWMEDWVTDGPIPWCSHGWYLDQRPEFALEPLWHAGAFYVQEASSMLLCSAIKQWLKDKPILALDLCAAPGGKSTLLTDVLPEGSLLVANEVIGSRNHILQENLTKWGREAVLVTQNDPADFQAFPGMFDLVVVDAPCSGSGLWRKDPDAVTHWSVDAVEHCSLRQRRILQDIEPCLKPGGVLVYATCSYSKEENEHQMSALASSGTWTPLELEYPETWGLVASRTRDGQPLGYRCYPDRLKGEGFFFSGWIKRAGSGTKIKEHRYRGAIRRIGFPAEAASMVIADPALETFHVQDQLFLFPAVWESSLKLLASNLYVKQAGIRFGKPAKSGWIPEHALALSAFVRPEVPRLDLNLTEALAYLRRDSLSLESFPQGWALACYKSVPLGWIKGLQGRVNNYFPTTWRIRKSGDQDADASDLG